MRRGQGGSAHVGQGQHAVQQPQQVQLGDHPEDDAALGQDHRPTVGLDDVAGPHRQHHADVEEGLGSRPGVSGHVVRDREGDNRRGDGDRTGHRQSAEHDVKVPLFENLRVVVQRQRRQHAHRKIIEAVEALPQQGEQRSEVNHAHPDQRRAQQHGQHQAAATMQQRRHPAQRRAQVEGVGVHAGISRKGTIAWSDQVANTSSPTSGSDSPSLSSLLTFATRRTSWSSCNSMRLLAP